jgi:hypothetical protein
MKLTIMRVFFYSMMSVILISCSEQLKISTGAKDYEPLIFNGEYVLKDLNPIEVEGRAFWGIPSFTMNNKNKNKNGLLFTFNGVHFGQTPRILPILSMVSLSIGGGMMISTIAGYKKVEAYGKSYIGEDRRISPWLGTLVAIPLAGAANNYIWRNSSFSGASKTLNFKLVDENPQVDIFCYPKYEINKSYGFWTQKASVKANVIGATLKRN